MQRYIYAESATPLEFLTSGVPVYLYGMGNGAEKAFDWCRYNVVSVSGVFASDGFVRNKEFFGFPVLSIDDVKRSCPSGFAALVCFGCAAVDMKIYAERVTEAGGIVIFPDMPLFDSTVFRDPDFLSDNAEHISKLRGALSGGAELLDSLCLYFRTWRPEPLFSAVSPYTGFDYMCDAPEIHRATDGGAYRGDTLSDLYRVFPELSHTVAAEPDPQNYRKLADCCKAYPGAVPLNAALYSDNGTLPFCNTGNRGAHVSGTGETSVRTVTLDSLGDTDYIKLDVEGCEAEALFGAKNTILRCRPVLYISVYHKPRDFFEIPLALAGLCADYSFYLLRRPVCPAWDIILLAIPKEKEKKS